MDLDWLTFERGILLAGPVLTLWIYLLGQRSERRREATESARARAEAAVAFQRDLLVQIQDRLEDFIVAAVERLGRPSDDATLTAARCRFAIMRLASRVADDELRNDVIRVLGISNDLLFNKATAEDKVETFSAIVAECQGLLGRLGAKLRD